MVNVYTKISGKLAMFSVDTEDPTLARSAVKDSLPKKHKKPIFAVVPKVDKSFLAFFPVI